MSEEQRENAESGEAEQEVKEEDLSRRTFIRKTVQVGGLAALETRPESLVI